MRSRTSGRTQIETAVKPEGCTPRVCSLPPAITRPHRAGFTLVELLVVITIIAILASLITVAAVGALNAAKQARIVLEISQLDAAFKNYKNDVSGGAFPPNGFVADSSNFTTAQRNRVSNDFVRHFKKAFPRHREPDELIRRLAVSDSTGSNDGLSPAEAIVFWLGGFSNDPKYPISGAGGPSFQLNPTSELEDFASRDRQFDFDIGRIGPRDEDGNFAGRFVDYMVTFNNQTQTRRINLWQYAPANSDQPYVYFDTSGTPLPDSSGNTSPGVLDIEPSIEPHVHAIKIRKDTVANPSSLTAADIRYANDDNFQILHCGIDDDWGEFDAMSTAGGFTSLLLYPDGPFTGALADTVTNFTEGSLADAQP